MEDEKISELLKIEVAQLRDSMAGRNSVHRDEFQKMQEELR